MLASLRHRIARGAALPCLALIAAAGPAPAARSEGLERVAVAPPRFENGIAGLGAGYADWVRSALAAVGVEVVSREATRAAAGSVVPGREDVAGLGADLDAGFVLLTEATAVAGRFEIQVRLYETATNELVGFARTEEAVQALGTSAREVTASIVEQAGLRAEAVRDAPAPRLIDLAAASRALAALDRGDLGRAWREVDGRLSPTADRIRERIEAASGGEGVTTAVRARLWIAQGQPDRAAQLVRPELRSSRDPEVFIAAADAAVALRDPRRAVELYERAIELGGDRADAYLGLGRALSVGKRYEQARAAVERAAELDPADPEPLEALVELWSDDPARAARYHLLAGQRAAARFESKRAERSFERAEQLAPRDTGRAPARMASFQRDLGNPRPAIRAYERAIERGNADADTWRGLADARRAVGDHRGAEVAYTHALELAPDDPQALRGIAELYATSGRRERAVAALERAVDLAPEDAELRRSLARALHAKGDHERALALLTARGSGTPDAADLRTAASIHADRGERGAARAALARAVELEPESPELRDALAEALEANGEAAAAEAERATARGFRGGHLVELARDAADEADTSLADAPEASHSAADLFDEILTTFPKRNPQTGRPIATVALTDLRLETYETADRVWEWLAPRRLDRLRFEAALTTALSRHFELAPVEKIELIAAELEHLQDASPDPSAVAIVNAHLETDAVFTVLCFARSLRWTGFAEPAGSYAVELRMLAGASQPAVVVLENGLRLPDDAGAVQWNPRALAIYAFVVLLLASPLLRGWGTLLVRIEYESLGKSVFSIRVSKKPEKAKQGKSRRNASNRIARFQRRLRFVGRYQRHMVGKQTRFAWLPARTYHVAVHGLLQDAVNDEVVGNYFEEKIARVRRGRAVELGFDFRPTECPVEVTVMRGDQRDCQATVALRGDLHSQRYARDGTAILYLGKGRHGILIGSTDRVAEREVEIDTLEPRSVLLNLADEHLLVFRDCPAAVEPYLQNDLEAAARALERGGQAEHANLLRAEHYQTLGQTEKAAVHFEAAGRDAEAADLRAALADHARAAALYERAGDYARAAEMYRLGGDPARAGAAYESWGEFDAAIECFREAGDRARESDLLEKTGRYYEAAQLCMELGDVDAAIRALQQIDGHQPEYGEGCRLLAQLLSERGEFDLAIQKFEEAITIAGDSRAPIETQEQFADLLTRAERYEAALEVYERIRAREFHHAGATARIAELKTRIAEATQPVAPAVTESRYEILGELGRGGMGVVFKARDRRLGRTVALKQLPENLRDHPTAVALFLREARAAAALNHMNIVTLFDAGEENGVYFLTMELLEGHPLQKILAHRRQLTPRDVGRLGLQVAAALNYAHGRRIVHRDIKTANLFFTRERVLKVMDFGLAKMLEEVRRASTVIGGTPYYMAPEQGAGEAVDHRADLYALGVTLFELATGGVPYRDGDVIHHHRHSPIPDPRERVDGIPDVLAELILALMAKDPDDRPESAAVVSAHLQRVVDASA